MKILSSLLLAVILIAQPLGSLAFETDQYNLPPVPLADIGDEVSLHVEKNVLKAVENINGQIGHHELCIGMTSERLSGCGPVALELDKLAYLRSNDAIANEVAGLLAGQNLATTKFGSWMHSHKFRGQPDRFKTSYAHSIFVLSPADYVTVSPTVRLYGIELGIDKLEHLFQQGHQYYEIERKAIRKGETPEEAVKPAVDWGKQTERTYYGLLSSGVYSNADLYANYAGMRFYQGLTESVSVGDATRPAIVILENGYWKTNPKSVRDQLLKPFISNHMNEALNPSAFSWALVSSVRRAVKKYACDDWHRVHPDLTAASLLDSSKALETWHGEDYGWTKNSRTVTIADECFAETGQNRER